MTETSEGKRLDPPTRFVRSLEGDYFKLSEAAEMLGVSHRTLRNFLGEYPQELGPSYVVYFGKLPIYLYTRDDVDKIRKYLQERKTVMPLAAQPRPTGRPRKWSAAQRKERQRLFSQAHYYRGRIRTLAKAGKSTKAAEDKLRKIETRLKSPEDQDG